MVPKKQEGTGTVHRMKELMEIKEKMPFDWQQNIAAFKAAWQEGRTHGTTD